MARNITMPRGGNGNIPGNNRWSSPPIRMASRGKATENIAGSWDAWTGSFTTVNPNPLVSATKIKIKAAKEIHVVPKEETEKPISLDPFVSSHRIGVAERVTNMDPLGEEFIRSLNLTSSGQGAGVWGHPMFTKFFFSTTEVHKSRAIRDFVSYINDFTVYDIGAAGKPWNKEAWIVPRFQIGTGVVIPPSVDDPDRHRFEAAKFALNLWKFRPTETEVSCAGVRVKVTLVNHFEAVKGLECYSFVIKHGTEEAIYHVWLNDVIMQTGNRRLPMYFEMGGAANFIANAVIACFGFSIDAKGGLHLSVEFKDRTAKVSLDNNHLHDLEVRRVLTGVSGAVVGHGQPAIGFDFSDNYVKAWDTWTGANWSNLGFILGSGLVWSSYGDLRHLPWQVQPLLKKFNERVGGGHMKLPSSPFESSRKAADFFTLSIKDRAQRLSSVLSKAFWQDLQGKASEFDQVILEIRQMFVTEEILEELKRLHPDITGTDMEEMMSNRSDKIGRFVFERSDPQFKVIQPPMIVKTTGAQSFATSEEQVTAISE